MSAPYTATVMDALAAAAEAEHDFARWLAAVLATVAAPVRGRRALLRQLVQGTVGYDDVPGSA